MEYRKAIEDILNSRKYMTITEGEGIKKRNGYKIVNSKYNNKLYINMPKLLNKTVIEVVIDGNIIYTNKANRSTIDLLAKRHNPKKTYSKLSIQIFNDLNQLSSMVKKRNGKSKLIENSIILNEKDSEKR